MRAPRGVTSPSYDGFISYSHAADGLLAPRLQAGLQRFAKPWWKRRALRLFRDESSLSANPHLWSSITEALDTSAWFVLLLSPDAAQSEWVGQEIEYWITNRDAGRILPVVTDGEFGWSGGDVSGDAVPDALQGVFSEEPRWVDLRWAKDEEQLDLQDPRFADAVADIGSAIRGVPKDELASEEVRQHRRTVRTAWAGGVALTVLTLLSGVLALLAAGNANEAERQADAASANAALADDNARQAEQNAEEAAVRAAEAVAATEAEERQRLSAESSAALARSRELLTSSIAVRADDPELSILLGEMSLRAAEDASDLLDGRTALREAWAANRIVTRFEVANVGWTFADLSHDGRQIVIASDEERSVALHEVESGLSVWETVFGDTTDTIISVSLDPGEQIVAVSILDQPLRSVAEAEGGKVDDGLDARVVILDAGTGQRVTMIPTGPCPSARAVSEHTFTPDGRWLVVYSGNEDCGVDAESDWLSFYRTDDWSLDFTLDHGIRAIASFADDMESYVIFGEAASAELRSFPDHELIRGFGPNPWAALSPDGSRVVVADPFGLGGGVAGLRPALYDTETGELVDVLEIDNFLSSPLRFSPDSSVVFGGNRSDDRLWNARTGAELLRLPNAITVGSSFTEDGALLATSHADALAGTVLVWAVGPDPRASNLSLESRTPAFVNSDRIEQNDVTSIRILAAPPARDPNAGLLHRFLTVLDPASGVVTESVRVSGSAPLDGDRYVVVREATLEDGDIEHGPLAVWSAATNSFEVVDECVVTERTLQVGDRECERPRAFVGEVASSTDRSEFAVTGLYDGTTSPIRIYDALTLGPIRTIDVPVDVFEIALFHEDALLVGYEGGENLGVVSVFDATTGDLITDLPPRPWRLSREWSADGRHLFLGRLDGFVSIVDSFTWAEVGEWKAHDANNRGLALSPSGEVLATTGEDDSVALWDVTVDPPTLIDILPFDFPSDAVWIDDDTLGVALADPPAWAVVHVSDASFRIEVLDSLSRSFTAEECITYRIDPCPSLEELRGG